MIYYDPLIIIIVIFLPIYSMVYMLVIFIFKTKIDLLIVEVIRILLMIKYVLGLNNFKYSCALFTTLSQCILFIRKFDNEYNKYAQV
jgi:hypothetical protein